MKPIAQKRLEGTYRADRDKARDEAEKGLAASGVIFPPGTRVSCPKTVRTRYARAFWKTVTESNIALGQLAPVDLPQVEEMCITLEKVREAREAFQDEAPSSPDYDRLRDSWLKLSRRFDELAAKYYVSPQARSRLALDAFNAAKAAKEAKAADGAIAQLLAERK